MTSETKRKDELKTFNRFIKATRMNIDPASITQLPPPNPDIVCKICGDDYGFELTALTDETIEKKLSINKPAYSNYRIEINDVVERIKCKSAKNYSTSDIDLVLYEAATPIDDLWLLDSHALDSILQDATEKSIFLRVWIIDFSSNVFRCYARN